MNKLISGSAKFIKRNAATIMTCVGGIGVVVTTATAIKSTPKALALLEEAKEEKGEELTKIEVIRTVSPVYIPTVLIGASTLACIFGSNALNKRAQASLLSAYAVLNNSYKEYKNKVTEVLGEDGELEIQEEIAKDHYVDVPKTVDLELFYDAYSGRYFESTTYKVKEAEYQLNRHLIQNDYVLLSHWYEFLGLETVEGHERLGWSTCMNFDYYWETWIEFGHKKCVTEDGRPYTMVALQHDPYMDWDDCF